MNGERRMAIRDWAARELESRRMPHGAYVILSVLLNETNGRADPIERRRSTIARKAARSVRTVTHWTSWLARRGVFDKQQRKVRTAGGQYRSRASRFTFAEQTSRVVTRPDTRTTPRPPAPSSTAAGSVLVGVPPVRSARPAGPPTLNEQRIAAIIDRSRAP